MSEKTRVALIKGDDPKTSVNEALKHLGGIERYVRPRAVVVIKPNLVYPAPQETGQTTDPEVIRAVIDLCKKAKASRIIIGDAPVIGSSGREVIRATGVEELAKETGVETLDFHEDNWVEVKIPDGIGTKRARFPQTVLTCHTLINVPKMKCHPMTMVTLALKNFQGLMHGNDKFEITHGAPDYKCNPKPGGPPYARLGLEYALVDLHRVVRTNLNIVDGIVGPTVASWGGKSDFKPGLIVAGEDPVAVDTVATKAMGLDPAMVNMIQIADEIGIGTAKLDEIEVVGAFLNEVNAGYTIPPSFSVTKAEEFEEPNLHKIAGTACNICLSSCQHPLGRITQATQSRLKPTDFEEMTFVVGKDAVIPSDYFGKLILYGNCAVRQYQGIHPFENAISCLGCPPAATLAFWRLWKRGKINALKAEQ